MSLEPLSPGSVLPGEGHRLPQGYWLGSWGAVGICPWKQSPFLGFGARGTTALVSCLFPMHPLPYVSGAHLWLHFPGSPQGLRGSARCTPRPHSTSQRVISGPHRPGPAAPTLGQGRPRGSRPQPRGDGHTGLWLNQRAGWSGAGGVWAAWARGRVGRLSTFASPGCWFCR